MRSLERDKLGLYQVGAMRIQPTIQMHYGYIAKFFSGKG